MGVAYVIMPYAKEYERVYRNLIKPAVEECGLQCVRTDKELDGGHILPKVIRDLAEAEIVIADLSSRNWNVAYELGIRHTMKKSGTIILCDDENFEYPFDIRGYDIIQYEKDWLQLDKDEEIIKKIVSHINSSLSTSSKSDNPVHDLFTTLPHSMMQIVNTENNEELKQIQELQSTIDELENERNSLHEYLEQLGLDPNRPREKVESSESKILEAYNDSQFVSDAAVDKMRELIADGKKEEFVKFLAKVLDRGFLDETDCRIVFALCRKLDNPTIVRIFLEKAVEFYPDSEELQGFLADTYSSDYRTKEKALTMANTTIGLIKRNGSYELQPKLRSNRIIGSFFNVYIELKLFREMVDIGYLLLEQSPKHEALILRNIVLGYEKLEQFDKAVEIAKRLIEMDAMNDISHYCVFRLHNEMNHYFAAYRELEKCIACDNEDTDYYRAIAGLICDEHVARNAAGNYIRISVSEKEQYAVPFLLRGLQVDSNFVDQAIAFLKRNRMTRTLQRLLVFINSCQCSPLEVDYDSDEFYDSFSDFDFSAVNLCMEADCYQWESEEG